MGRANNRAASAAEDSRQYAALLKRVRKQLGLSQEGLARELGVSFASINRWENGQHRPSKLARTQVDAFCARLVRQGRLSVPTRKS